MTTRTEIYLIIGMLCCSALGIFVIGPFVASLSATQQTLGSFALWAAGIWFIGWGSSLR